MPKKKKAERASSDIDIGNERPSNLTLGDYITFSIPNSSVSSATVQQPISASNFLEEAPVYSAAAQKNRQETARFSSLENSKTDYFICRTKKGGIPVKVENRASGKKVTLIENVKGDAKLFLQDLKIRFGTGGVVKDGVIELQGDFKVKLSKYINDNKQELLKPYGSVR